MDPHGNPSLDTRSSWCIQAAHPFLAIEARLRYLLIGAAVAALVVILAASRTGLASEYGVSTYRPGLMDLYAGILPPPGNGIVKDLFLFQDATAGVVTEDGGVVTEDGKVEINTHTISYTDAVLAAYVKPVSVLGAYWAFGTIQMLRITSQSADAGPHGGLLHNQTTTIGGLGDGIFIPGMLNWNFGQFHVTSAFSFYAPTGNYDRSRIIDLGLNRGRQRDQNGTVALSGDSKGSCDFLGPGRVLVTKKSHVPGADVRFGANRGCFPLLAPRNVADCAGMEVQPPFAAGWLRQRQ